MFSAPWHHTPIERIAWAFIVACLCVVLHASGTSYGMIPDGAWDTTLTYLALFCAFVIGATLLHVGYRMLRGFRQWWLISCNSGGPVADLNPYNPEVVCDYEVGYCPRCGSHLQHTC
jgi:hypothetical protein